MNKLKVQMTSETGIIPTYGSEHAAGFDIAAKIESYKVQQLNKNLFGIELDTPGAINVIHLYPHQRIGIPTGIRVSIPEGFQLEIRPRSGNAIKKGLMVINSPGTLDADYRGELMVLLYNGTDETIVIKDGDKIAQGVITPYYKAEFELVEKLDETVRGEGGFGSTDKQ